MKPSLPLAVLIALVTSRQALADAPVTQPDGYSLAWADEFNTDGPLNSADWNYEKGSCGRTQELQWYQADNGDLPQWVIGDRGAAGTQAEPQLCRWIPGLAHGPGVYRIHGGERKYFPQTHLPIRAIRDPGPDPTPDAGSWLHRPSGRLELTVLAGQANGEIDIMEYYRHMLQANIAWQCDVTTGGPARWNSVKTPLSKLGDGWSEQFHHLADGLGRKQR